MADLFTEYQKRHQTEAARKARQDRRAHRQATVYSQLGSAIRNDNTHAQRFADTHKQAFEIRRVDGEERALDAGLHPGDSALGLAYEALTQFQVPGTLKLRYGGMDRQAGKGGHGISDGTIYIEGELKPIKGMASYFTVPIIVKASKMLYPSLLLTGNGIPRILAQSTFDDLMNQIEIDQTVTTDRQPFDAPSPSVSTPRPRQSNIDRDALRSAMRGWKNR